MVICLERGADCLHNGPADAVASQNHIVVLDLEKRPLNGCSSSSLVEVMGTS